MAGNWARAGAGQEEAQDPGRPGTCCQVRRGKHQTGDPTKRGRGREGVGKGGPAPADAPQATDAPPPRAPGAPSSPTFPDPHLAKAEAVAGEPPRLPGLNPGKGGTEAAEGGTWRLGPGPLVDKVRAPGRPTLRQARP